MNSCSFNNDEISHVLLYKELCRKYLNLAQLLSQNCNTNNDDDDNRRGPTKYKTEKCYGNNERFWMGQNKFFYEKETLGKDPCWDNQCITRLDI